MSALLRRYDPVNESRLAADDWLTVATAQRAHTKLLAPTNDRRV